MTDSLTDRSHRFLARAQQREKTPILAEAPVTKPAGDGVVMLRLYDVIDSWGGPYGVSAKEFADVLDALPDTTTEIHLHVNSPGGEVWDGLAILNLLRQHKARVVAIVDGLAASAASFVCMGADEVVMSANSEMMVHSPWGLCVGNAMDMQKMADDLAHEGKNLAQIYAAKAGGSVDDWHAVMAAETWFSAEEAVAAGLADRVDAAPADTGAKARFDLSIFAYAGRDKAPAPQAPVASASGRATAGGRTHEVEVGMSDTLLDGLREQLGLPADADEATVLAKNQEALASLEELNEKAAASAIPEGHVVVPEARLRDLEAGVAASAEIGKKIKDKEREEFLDSVRTKYAPANRAAWATEYDRDPAGTRAHFEKAPEIVALTMIGHQDEGDDTEADRLYAELYGPTQKVS